MPIKLISSIPTKDLIRAMKSKSSEIGCDSSTKIQDQCLYNSMDITDYCDSCLLALAAEVLEGKIKVAN